MFIIPESFEESKNELMLKVKDLIEQGYEIENDKIDVYEGKCINKITIIAKNETKKKLIFSSGLHGIEGFVGHAALMSVLDNIVPLVNKNTEVIIYHTLNPYGMINKCRVNENHVDLNRNFYTNDFQFENTDYKVIKKIMSPKQYKFKFFAVLRIKLIVLRILLFASKDKKNKLIAAYSHGQNKFNNRICYAGDKYQNSTNYMISEQKKLLETSEYINWIDLHTGVAFKKHIYLLIYDMERDMMDILRDKMEYITIPKIMETGFAVDGPINSYIYGLKEKNYPKTKLVVSTLEFCTGKAGVFAILDSVASAIIENSTHFYTQNRSILDYVEKEYYRQYVNTSEKWLKQVDIDFVNMMKVIIELDGLEC